MRIQLQINQPYISKNLTFHSLEENDKSHLESDNKVENEKKDNPHFASAITIATLSVVGMFFMLSRGFQKNTGRFLNKMKEFFEGRQALSSVSNSKKRTKFYEYAIRKTNSFIKKSESINNITSLKDILFMKLMYKTKPTKEIHQSITNYFEELSRKTVMDSYKNTSKDFKRMNSIFDELDKYILKENPDEKVNYQGKEYTKKELVELAKNYRDRANIIINGFMSKESVDYRYKYIHEVTESLYSKFWDASFKDFWSKDNKFKRKEMWQTFIAAEQIKGDKTKLIDGVAAARNAISYTNTDRTEIMNNYIANLDGIIPADDLIGADIVKKISWFVKSSERLKDNKELFLSELKKLEEHKITTADKNLAKTQEESKDSYIRLIRELLEDDATGEIQDMLSIYYKLSPFELEKSGALLSVKRAVKSFDKSVNYESVEFFDKVRDLKLGSAPTDVLTILASFIMLSVGLGHAKDKDKRTSIMLKSGIPIVGAISVATLSATKLVSGGKSLALGFISGIALNQIGIIADNLRKKMTKSKMTSDTDYDKI